MAGGSCGRKAPLSKIPKCLRDKHRVLSQKEQREGQGEPGVGLGVNRAGSGNVSS